mmetsp:Transcript_173/g.1305  ORF Transcript_173/g.1305 Transcript_173/m.1305 type:complete len:104 (+) Transcript_173:1115-1426(+)
MAPVESGEILFIDEVHEKGTALHGRAVRVLGTCVDDWRLLDGRAFGRTRNGSPARADTEGGAVLRPMQRRIVRCSHRIGFDEAQRERNDRRHLTLGRRACAAG